MRQANLGGLALAVCGVMVPGAALHAASEEQNLFELGSGFDVTRVATSDAQVSLSPGRGALRVATGHEKPWPGVTLSAPTGAWDVSSFGHVTLDLKNLGSHRATIYGPVHNPGANGAKNCVTGSLTLDPNQAGPLRVQLKRHGPGKLGGTLFGLRGLPLNIQSPFESRDLDVNPAKVIREFDFLERP